MRPDISEFSFGYALTEELTQSYKLVGAPEFPSLYKEGRSGGGYDVKLPVLGAPLFLQFKISNHMVTSRAAEAYLLDIPYYRMHLRPLKHSSQHNLLLELEARFKEVYYAAPEFHTTSALNQGYLRREILQNSFLVAPSSIGMLPDDGEHYVAFSPNSSKYYICSEPRQLDVEAAPTIINHLIRQTAVRSLAQRIDEEFFLSMGDELLRIYTESPHLDPYRDIVALVLADDIPGWQLDLYPRRRREILTLARLEDISERELLARTSSRDYNIVIELRSLRNLHQLRSRVRPHQYVYYISRNLFECELLLAVNRT